jgi:excisionase family DNA binding protein
MRRRACPSGRAQSATRNKTFEPVSAIDERASNLPAWAISINQNAGADDLRRRPQLQWLRFGTHWNFSRPPAPLMTVDDAAELLRVSSKTIRRLIERGELEAVRIGRSVRLRSADVFRIIEQGQ